jgi:hypothetical protein
MSGLDRSDRLFLAASLGIQAVLVVYFAMRKWQVAAAMPVGWIVYALAVPAVVVSLVLIRAGKAWYFASAGFLYALWAAFGTVVDIVHPVAWRSPILWPIFLPYVLTYTASMMFYWWPLLRIHRLSWFIYAALYALSTFLNVSSH